MLLSHFRDYYIPAMEQRWQRANTNYDEPSRWLKTNEVAWLLSAMHDHFQRVIQMCKQQAIGPYGNPKLSAGFVANSIPLTNVIKYYNQNKKIYLPDCHDTYLAHLCLISGEESWGDTVEVFLEHALAAFYSSYKFLIAHDSDAVTEFLNEVAAENSPLPKHILELCCEKNYLIALNQHVEELIRESKDFQKLHKWWVEQEYESHLREGRIIVLADSSASSTLGIQAVSMEGEIPPKSEEKTPPKSTPSRKSRNGKTPPTHNRDGRGEPK